MQLLQPAFAHTTARYEIPLRSVARFGPVPLTAVPGENVSYDLVGCPVRGSKEQIVEYGIVLISHRQLETAAEPIHRPGSNHVDTARCGVLEQPVQAGRLSRPSEPEMPASS